MKLLKNLFKFTQFFFNLNYQNLNQFNFFNFIFILCFYLIQNFPEILIINYYFLNIIIRIINYFLFYLNLN
jgi:hypothetical protein